MQDIYSDKLHGSPPHPVCNTLRHKSSLPVPQLSQYIMDPNSSFIPPAHIPMYSATQTPLKWVSATPISITEALIFVTTHTQEIIKTKTSKNLN